MIDSHACVSIIQSSFPCFFPALQGTLIKCNDSADRLSTLLLVNDYQSGSHLDFYDLAKPDVTYDTA